MTFKIKLNNQHVEKTTDEIRALIKETYIKKHKVLLPEQELNKQLEILLYLLHDNKTDDSNKKNKDTNKTDLTKSKKQTKNNIRD